MSDQEINKLFEILACKNDKFKSFIKFVEEEYSFYPFEIGLKNALK